MKANKLLLALPIFLGMVGCAKTTTKKITTTNKPTTIQTTTEKKTTERQTTARRTTTQQTTTQYVSTEKMNFYCWNSDFQDILNKYYTNVKKTDGARTILNNGIVINWVMLSNQSIIYQSGLDDALVEGLVDMYLYEASYAKKYIYSEFVVDMETLGIDQSDQYQYTKDIVTNLRGRLVGSTWEACPGVIAYNKNVVESVWPGVTHAQMETKLSTYENFLSSATDVTNAGKQMMIHPSSWYRMYYNNLDNKTLDDAGTRIIIDKNLFRWVNDTISMKGINGFAGIDNNYGQWSEQWGNEIGANNTLCIFSTTWMNDYVIPSYRSVDADGDLGLRVVAGYKPWYWNGSFLTATPQSQTKKDIKDEVARIISELTTNKTILRTISDRESLFTNSITAMEEKGNDSKVTNALFGGQNIYKQYADAALLIDASKENSINDTLFSYFESAFIEYIKGSKKASEAWSRFKTDLSYYCPFVEGNILLPDGVTINDDLVIE